MPPRFSLLTTQGVCFPVSVFFLYITPQQHFCEKRWSKCTRLLLDSRVVIGQFLRNSLFLQAFYEGRDRSGIFGKSHLISSAYVLSMMCKTPESNKSQGQYEVPLVPWLGASALQLIRVV